MADLITPDNLLEHFAIRCAKGNNGGEWATHYTEDQKNFWRSFVRHLYSEITKSHGSGSVGARLALEVAPMAQPKPMAVWMMIGGRGVGWVSVEAFKTMARKIEDLERARGGLSVDSPSDTNQPHG